MAVSYTHLDVYKRQPMQHTIELMKNKNQLQQKVVEFIKNADLYMDNFEYVDTVSYTHLTQVCCALLYAAQTVWQSRVWEIVLSLGWG